MCSCSTAPAIARGSHRRDACCSKTAGGCYSGRPGSRTARAARGHRLGDGLRVAVDTLVPFARVFPLVAAFYAECRARSAAHTRLKLSREVLGGAWDALADGRADLVLGAPADPPAGGGYRLRMLAETTMIFAVAPQTSACRRGRAACPKRRSPGTAESSPQTRRDAWRREPWDCWRAGHAHRAGHGCQARRTGRGTGMRLPARVHRGTEVAAGRLVVKAVELRRSHLCA